MTVPTLQNASTLLIHTVDRLSPEFTALGLAASLYAGCGHDAPRITQETDVTVTSSQRPVVEENCERLRSDLNTVKTGRVMGGRGAMNLSVLQTGLGFPGFAFHHTRVSAQPVNVTTVDSFTVNPTAPLATGSTGVATVDVLRNRQDLLYEHGLLTGRLEPMTLALPDS